MAEFAKYYVEFLWTFLQNVWGFIYSILYAFYKFFIKDVGDYFVQLGKAVPGFDVLGWICLVVVSIVTAVLVFFLVYRLVQLIRRYIIHRSKEVSKDKLEEQVARLQEQADNLVKEKNQIFALKFGTKGGAGAAGSSEVAEADGSATPEVKDEEKVQSRFVKLANLDIKYGRNPNIIYLAEDQHFTLEQIVKRFVNFSASQLKLYYTEETVRLFFSALATSKIVILEGISGTGKTSLPYAMGKFFCNDAAIISVQPSWRDRAELLGYFNEFTQKFNETDFLSSLYERTLREDPGFIVLDEMNLARIEYYFAEFLSIMEMPDIAEWKIDLIAAPRADDPKNIVYGKLLVPQNVWFVGTANNDDSTFTITDKVYDRAVALSLNTKADYFDAPMEDSYQCPYSYLEMLFDNAVNEHPVSEKSLNAIHDLDVFIQTKFKISFGNRIMKQIKLFVPTYVACGGSELSAIDFMISSKILRKFNSLNLPFLQKELQELCTYFDKKFGKGNMPYCLDYVKQLQKMI